MTTTWLAHAGPYPVERHPCGPFAGAVDMAGPRTGVLHTTEGNSLPLGEFEQHYAPHFTLDSKRIVQCLPIGTSATTTRAHNVKAIVQIEMVGFSKEQPWFPDEETAWRLAAVMAAMKDLFQVPLFHPWPDGDFGRAGHNPHRAAGTFGKVAGWYGHGDMPDPDVHWDPGALKWSKVFALAGKFLAKSDAEPTGDDPTRGHEA